MRSFIGLTAAGLIMISNAHATSWFDQIGSSSLFTNMSSVPSGTYATDVAGQVAPFNAIIGSDSNGPDFSATWTFNYGGPLGFSVGDATLTIGTWDFDTQNTSGSQIQTFTVNGIDLSSELNTIFDANRDTLNQEIMVYAVPLPATLFASIESTGMVTVDLVLQNGYGTLGDTIYNGGGVYFSSIDAETPEPFTVGVTFAGLAMLGLIAWRRGILQK